MKFTDSHEWVEKESDDAARVGITSYAQRELGDIVYVELPLVGKQVRAGEEAAVLESTKAAADLYSPLTGTVFEVNSRLNDFPELVNQAPEQEGWIYKVRFSNPGEWEALMERADYEAMLNGAPPSLEKE